MPPLTAAEAARITGGRLVGEPDAAARMLVGDSRTVVAGAGFVAIRGGHAFVGDAVTAGASFVVVEDPAVLPSGASGVVVPDVVRAMAALASHVRRHIDAMVVGITGSTGKTTTKDLLTAALGTQMRVHASPASYNNPIGVPLVVLNCPDDAEALVIEMGARRDGDIAELCRIARPSVGIVTGIGLTHLGVFGSRGAIARTKSELPASLPAEGVAVLPADDDFLDVLVASTAARVVTVGPGGHVRVLEVVLDERGHPTARVDVAGREVVVRLAIPGRALVRNAAFALAAAHALGVDPAAAAEALATAPTSAWRMEVRRADGRTIVNDAYNANPTSTSAALRTVREVAGDRPAWAVLGEMAELGPAAPGEHERIGRLAAALGFARVVVVGEGAAGIVTGAGPLARPVPGPDDAARLVAVEAPGDAVVLVKASRAAGLERVAALLCDGAGAVADGRSG